MKAILVKGINQFNIEETPTPSVTPDSMLVKILACGICGSDIRILGNGNKRVTYPAILGHEICAEVVEIGKDVTGFAVGDRLAIGADIPCGTCDWCLSGNGN